MRRRCPARRKSASRWSSSASTSRSATPRRAHRLRRSTPCVRFRGHGPLLRLAVGSTPACRMGGAKRYPCWGCLKSMGIALLNPSYGSPKRRGFRHRRKIKNGRPPMLERSAAVAPRSRGRARRGGSFDQATAASCDLALAMPFSAYSPPMFRPSAWMKVTSWMPMKARAWRR
ncbi:hypothetical protein D3C78_1454390 [compost metagenome]